MSTKHPSNHLKSRHPLSTFSTLGRIFLLAGILMCWITSKSWGQRVYADAQQNVGNNGIGSATIANPTFAVTPSLTDFSTLTVSGVGASESQNIQFTGTTKPLSSSPVIIKYKGQGGGSGVLGVANATTLQRTLNGSSVGSSYNNSSLLSLLGTGILGSDSSVIVLMPPPSLNYDGIQLQVAVLLGVNITANYYYAFIITPPAISSPTICAGSPATLTISNFQSGYFYRLYNSGGTLIDSTSGSSFTTASLSTTTSYYVIASESSAVGAYYSGQTPVTVTVNALPAITTQPSGSIICANANTSFIIAATGTSLTYQWQLNTGSGFSNITNGGIYSGATSATLSLTTVPASANNYSYQCIVTGTGSCPKTSNTATLTVNALPTASATNNGPICNGATATYTITGTSSAVLTYNINGGTNNTVTLTGGTATINNTNSTANVILNLVSVNLPSTNCSQTLGTSSTVIVNALPTASIASNNSPICTGATANFNLAGTTGATVYYHVGSSVTALSTVLTSGAATVSPAASAPSVSITLDSVKSAAGCKQTLSASSTITVNALPTASATNNGPICNGATATYTITGTPGAVLTYNINGGTNNTVTLTGGTATINNTNSTANVTLNLVSVNLASTGCSQILGTSSIVTVNALPTASVATNNGAICNGATATFTVTGTPGAVLTYNINGGTNNTATLTGGTATINNTNSTANVTLNLVSVNMASTGCSQILGTSSIVTVNALPAITFSPSTFYACKAALQYSLSYSGATNSPTTDSIAWSAGAMPPFSNTATAAISNPILITIPVNTSAGGYNGTLYIKNTNGCSNNYPFTLNIVNPPNAPPLNKTKVTFQ